jgi:uncharacterized membrane protein
MLQDSLDSPSKAWGLSKALTILLIITIALGIGFRLTNLDKKVYWLDETHTSLRVYGYTEPEFIADLFNGEPVSPTDVLKYQQLSADNGWPDTFKALAGNSEHAPLYYLLVRLWSSWVGSSVAAIRSLSAIIGLLCLPSLYWLCLELFKSPKVGWLAVAVFSVSPFHVLYAQEARPYSLLTLSILVSSAMLLRSLRTQKWTDWLLYGLTVTIGCYTHWFFGAIAVSHGLYVLCIQQFKVFSRSALAYLASSIAAVVAFFPWIWITITAPPALEAQMGWIYERVPPKELLQAWMLNVSRAFFDLDLGPCISNSKGVCSYPLSYTSLVAFLWIVPIVALVVYAFYQLFRHEPRRVWLFISFLAVVMALAAIAPDFLSGGKRSTVLRYLIPCVVSIQLTVAYCLSVHLNKPLAPRQTVIWRGITGLVLTLGLISCLTISQFQGGWTKGGNYRTGEIATVINQAEKPLLVFSVPEGVTWGKGGAVGRVVPLIRLLNPDAGILFVVEPDIPSSLPDDYQTVFLYRPSKELRTAVAQQQNAVVEPAYQHALDSQPWVWKLTPQ